MRRGLFVIGTGTDVGKTYVTALIVKKLKDSGVSAAYYKAAMSGNQRDGDGKLIPGDALFVKEISGISQPLEEMCPYVYERAFSPHLASRIEGNPVKLEKVRQGFCRLRQQYEYVTMEGAGGILCPIGFDQEEIWLPDVINACGLGCVLVADAGLGTINAVGLTASYMRDKGLPLKGLILNRFRPGDVMHEDNLRMCEYITGVKAAACVREGAGELDISAEMLKSLYEEDEV